MSEAVPATTTSGEQSLQWVYEPGQVVFKSETKDQNVMGLSENGILKFVEDNGMTKTSADCRTASYDSDLVEPANGFSESTAYTHYKGQNSNGRLVFNGGNVANQVTVKKAGVLAICYCQFATAAGCDQSDSSTSGLHSDYWVLASRVTVKGPTSGHTWTFSSMVVFRLEYFGYGLTSDNYLRIISGDGKCSDNGRNPDKGAFAYTYLQVKCPEGCTNVGSISDSVNGDLQTQVVSSETFECDHQFQNCKRNDIKKITVVSDTETDLEFELPPNFESGVDVLTLAGWCFVCESVKFWFPRPIPREPF